jgi:hypothetical protein
LKSYLWLTRKKKPPKYINQLAAYIVEESTKENKQDADKKDAFTCHLSTGDRTVGMIRVQW